MLAYDLISSDESVEVEGESMSDSKQFSNSQLQSSSFENEVLKARVHDNLDTVADNSLNDLTWDSLLLATGVSSAPKLMAAYLFS